MTPAYVSIAQAKKNLNAPQLEDEEVEQKIQLATGYVRKYLKRWADVRAVMTSVSVASPTVITTATAHGFTTGDTVVISGVTDSDPDINGEHTLTVLDATSFSIPIAVTVAGTVGSAVVVWTEETAPMEVQWATLLWISYQHEHRGDDQEAFQAAYNAMVSILAGSRDPALV